MNYLNDSLAFVNNHILYLNNSKTNINFDSSTLAMGGNAFFLPYNNNIEIVPPSKPNIPDIININININIDLPKDLHKLWEHVNLKYSSTKLILYKKYIYTIILVYIYF